MSSAEPSAKPAASAAVTGAVLGKSGKKICCSCPETRKLRDACVVERGEAHCTREIEAHKACLREEGFRV